MSEGVKTSGKAITSLILGILSFCLPVVLTIPAVILGILGIKEINRSGGQVRGTGLAIGGIVTGVLGMVMVVPILIGIIMAATSKIQQSAVKISSTSRLREIGLALKNYESAHGHFPPAVLRGPKGHPYSWRVEILQEVEESSLYNQYNKSEPWDSPNNQRVLAQMPQVYASPSEPASPRPTTTYYQVFNGPGAVFDGPKFLSTFDVSQADGTSKTFLVVEAGQAVPWTKPEDLPYAPNQPLPKLGGIVPNGFNALFADGSVRFIPKSTSEQLIRAYITYNGKESIPADAP